MINVTKTFLPSFDEYTRILRRAWDKEWITNNGELLQELEQKLRTFHGVDHLLVCSNGTIVLQMALKALKIANEVITTPFSYVATLNAILWENCTPVFVDIDPTTLCVNPDQIESAITKNTEAILVTHVYGLPCDIEKIDGIAQKHKLKVIYDAAHAFGCTLKGKSLLSYGDIATCSFHATKLFHTVEGGCIVTHSDGVAKQLSLYRSFGHVSDDYFCVGINGKNSEFHAAMGLALLPKVGAIIAGRKKVFDYYDEHLPKSVYRPSHSVKDFEYNYAYYPIIFESEKLLLSAKEHLQRSGINARRYFYPSLNTLPQVKDINASCPISEDYGKRVLCLPLYPGIQDAQLEQICSLLKASFL